MLGNVKIILVGCGKMGSAMLAGWIKGGVKPENITVIEPFIEKSKLSNKKIKLLKDADGLKGDFDFCIFAVKPQSFDEVVKTYKQFAGKKCTFVSIAAGKTVRTLELILGKDNSVIRAMPNLPATIGAGVTALYFNKNVSAKTRKQSIALFGCVGDVAEVVEESQIDIVTAISGSGPAYIFHLIESLYEIGLNLGLDDDVALQLAKSTVYGSGKLAMLSDRAPDQLRSDVTSPGGTTEAALKVLMGNKNLEKLLSDAIKAAIARAKELQ